MLEMQMAVKVLTGEIIFGLKYEIKNMKVT